MASPPLRGQGTLARTPGSPSPPPWSRDDATPPSLSRALWQRRVPLLIAHAALGGWKDEEGGVEGAESEGHAPPGPVYAASVPRFGYLAQLLPRLTAFFGRPCSSFHFEDVPLRNLPVGLLVDLYRPPGRGPLTTTVAGGQHHEHEPKQQRGPWRLVVGDGEAWHLGDTFLNGAKEADYVRYGSAKTILGLSKANTEALWHAVQDNDYAAFARVNQLLLNAPTPLRHVPLRLYIPTAAPTADSSGVAASGATAAGALGSFRVLQALVPPRVNNRPQTLGPALRGLLPLLFPSSRDPVLAHVVLHGAPVPFAAPMEALMREAAYPDGWLCLVVVLL
ncbi:autophagy protein [Niveomyces insectorum RCEF 264]|uniref:Autophagy protein 5 n=1 Tax=Niveomyces insectorum RCEF 264 TaxID=1081102 RepID=A0A167VB08_9HYPO|nr:autophagy protein [Niveomyces insectorum RCEF 264]